MFCLIFCAVMALVPSLEGTIQPAVDSRSYFGPEFYRRNSFEVDTDYENSFMVSPAAVQKLLAVVYQGTEPRQADRMLFDFGVKHIDMKQLREIVKEETGSSDIGRSPEIRDRLMTELRDPCLKEDVLKYFEDDFTKTGDSIVVKNYIIAPSNLTPKVEFVDFAKKYFNTEVINKNSDKMSNIEKELADELKETEGVDLLNKITMKLKLSDSYTLANGNINAVVEAKYLEDEDIQYMDLPLENGLTLFLAIGVDKKELNYYITQVIGRRVQDFNDYYKDKWQTEKVLVHLPTIKFEIVNNIANFFKKPTVREGVKTMLQKDAKMTEAFENWPENGLKVESFIQLIDLDLQSADNTNAVNGPPTKTFDAIGKTLFFVVKDEKTFYLIGHYSGNK